MCVTFCWNRLNDKTMSMWYCGGLSEGRTKEKPRRTNNANIILCYKLDSNSNHKHNQKKRKETNLINIYGTHLWHKYAAVGLATFLSIFFKPNYHGNSAKGRGSGRTQAFHRALAKIHSKKFKFIQNILLLRVYKNVLLGSGQYLHKLFTKKVVMLCLKCRTPFFWRVFFFLFSFPKKVNKAIVTTQDPYTIQTLMYLQSLTYRSTVQNYWVKWQGLTIRARHFTEAWGASRSAKLTLTQLRLWVEPKTAYNTNG